MYGEGSEFVSNDCDCLGLSQRTFTTLWVKEEVRRWLLPKNLGSLKENDCWWLRERETCSTQWKSKSNGMVVMKVDQQRFIANGKIFD